MLMWFICAIFENYLTWCFCHNPETSGWLIWLTIACKVGNAQVLGFQSMHYLSIAYVLCMPDFFGIELYRPNIVVDIYSWRTLYATDLRSLVSVWSVCGWVTRVQGRRGILHATRGQSCRCHPCRKYRTLWRSRRTRSVSLGPSQANLGASYNAIQTHSHRAFIAAFNH